MRAGRPGGGGGSLSTGLCKAAKKNKKTWDANALVTTGVSCVSARSS